MEKKLPLPPMEQSGASVAELKELLSVADGQVKERSKLVDTLLVRLPYLRDQAMSQITKDISNLVDRLTYLRERCEGELEHLFDERMKQLHEFRLTLLRETTNVQSYRKMLAQGRQMADYQWRFVNNLIDLEHKLAKSQETRDVEKLLDFEVIQGKTLKQMGELLADSRRLHFVRSCPAYPHVLHMIPQYDDTPRIGQATNIKVKYENVEDVPSECLEINVLDPLGRALHHSVNFDVGFCLLSFQAETPGLHEVQVLLYKEHISNSPFKVKMRDAPPDVANSASSASWMGRVKGEWTEPPTEQLIPGLDPPPLPHTIREQLEQVALERENRAEMAGRGRGKGILPKTAAPALPAASFNISSSGIPFKTRLSAETRKELEEDWDAGDDFEDEKPARTPKPLATAVPKASASTAPKSVVSKASSSAAADSLALLPFNAPEYNRPDLSRFITVDRKLKGRLLLTLGTPEQETDREKHLSKPIGVSKNEATGEWIVCDTGHNLVKVFRPNGELKFAIEGSIDSRFRNPSAVLLLYTQGGQQLLCVKDDNNISIFHASDGRFHKTLGNSSLKRLYGLGLTSRGTIATLKNAYYGSFETEMCFLEPSTGAVLDSVPYRPFQNVKPTSERHPGAPQPRFMDVRGDTVVVTDLGCNKVYVTKLDETQGDIEFGTYGRRNGDFNFVSGVRVDGAGNFLIGDAKNNRVQVFSESGQHLAAVQLEGTEGHPSIFVSDLHLTRDGELMLALRYKHIVNIFKFQ